LPNRPDLPRLYAILDAELTVSRTLDPLQVADAWLAAGVRLIQLRAKTMASGAMLELALAIARRVRAAGATFILNDRADLARLAGADGVHVGQDDLAPEAVRAIVGPDAIVGLSTHTLAQVRAAMGLPVDYLAVGPVYATPTKGGAADPPIGVEGVRVAEREVQALGTPIVAIGGITLATAPEVMAAGASSVAVISDLLSPDPGRRAREYLQVLDRKGA
jgi:thiamine-phosphate pyrophosphorylase